MRNQSKLCREGTALVKSDTMVHDPSGEHRYFFKVYVLDEKLNLNPGIGKDELLKAIDGHLLQYAEIYGVYGR